MAKPTTKKASTRPQDLESEDGIMPPETEETESDTPAPRNARVFKGQGKIHHDLFKLKVAKMQRNVSWDGIEPDYVPTEHCHFFHTVDSNGKKMDACNAVGGHFHEIKVEASQDGIPKVTCSRAKVWAWRRVNGKKVRVAIDIEHDDHTHVMEYLGSQMVTMRKANMEFAKFQAEVTAKQQPTIDGVQER